MPKRRKRRATEKEILDRVEHAAANFEKAWHDMNSAVERMMRWRLEARYYSKALMKLRGRATPDGIERYIEIDDHDESPS